MYRVCVTGGSGGLGSHLLRLLCKEPNVDKIRSLDTRPLNLKYAFRDEEQSQFQDIERITADIRDKAAVKDYTKDCDVIFHAAASIDSRVFSDVRTMENVNVEGTKNIIHACLANSIPRLVHTSSIDVMIGRQDYVVGDSAEYVERPLIYHYGLTKRAGEQAVLASDGQTMANGDPLRVIVIRPHALFGEGVDPLVASLLQKMNKRGGKGPRIGTNGILPLTYAGNVAWGHIRAWKTSLTDPGVCGKPYIMEDDTPKDSYVNLVSPYLKSRGFKFTYSVPVPVLIGIARAVKGALTVLRPFKSDLNSYFEEGAVEYLTRPLIITEDKNSRKELGYEPLYDYDASVKRSRVYYDNLDID